MNEFVIWDEALKECMLYHFVFNSLYMGKAVEVFS